MSWKTDKAWSDRFIPEIKRTVGPLMLDVSPLEVDQKQAADLIVINGRDKTIACRMRHHGFAELYGNQFTIRSQRDTGATTELEKIENGFGDWLFYGHADAAEKHVQFWMVVDLSAFRAHMIRSRSAIKWGRNANGDGTYFAWFDVSTFPADPKILVASYLPADELCPI